MEKEKTILIQSPFKNLKGSSYISLLIFSLILFWGIASVLIWAATSAGIDTKGKVISTVMAVFFLILPIVANKLDNNIEKINNSITNQCKNEQPYCTGVIEGTFRTPGHSNNLPNGEVGLKININGEIYKAWTLDNSINRDEVVIGKEVPLYKISFYEFGYGSHYEYFIFRKDIFG